MSWSERRTGNTSFLDRCPFSALRDEKHGRRLSAQGKSLCLGGFSLARLAVGKACWVKDGTAKGRVLASA